MAAMNYLSFSVVIMSRDSSFGLSTCVNILRLCACSSLSIVRISKFAAEWMMGSSKTLFNDPATQNDKRKSVAFLGSQFTRKESKSRWINLLTST